MTRLLDSKCRGKSKEDAEAAWLVILEILKHELTEKETCCFAAGPLENLLSKHGDTFIERVEERVAMDPKFLSLLCRVWRLSMSDEVWRRVQIAQLGISLSKIRWKYGAQMSVLRPTSAAERTLSCCLRMLMICSSLNRLFFIRPPSCAQFPF
jgi:hypothetical protein